MSFDSFKSSTVGPEALAARLELEKKMKEQRERDKALRQRDKERREYNLAVAMEDSKNYEMSSEAAEAAPVQIPVLKRGGALNSPPAGKAFNPASNSQQPAQTANGFKLKRF